MSVIALHRVGTMMLDQDIEPTLRLPVPDCSGYIVREYGPVGRVPSSPSGLGVLNAMLTNTRAQRMIPLQYLPSRAPNTNAS